MRSKLMLKIVGSILAAATTVPLSLEAHATSASNTVSSVTIESGTQYARITIDGGPFGGRPSCHNAAFGSDWAFDISTAKGKAMLASAQAALLSGKRVSVSGGTTCTNVSGAINIETLTKIQIFAN
jgi:hypothetical protein